MKRWAASVVVVAILMVDAGARAEQPSVQLWIASSDEADAPSYHAQTIQAYEAEGLHVNHVSLNHEPTCCPSINYPSILLISSGQMGTMLKDFWFPAFKANHLTTKILLFDFNWANADRVEPLLKDQATRSSPFVGGVAWHGYSGDPKVVWHGQSFAYSLPVNTSVTFRWK
jgi:glucosylceramidase